MTTNPWISLEMEKKYMGDEFYGDALSNAVVEASLQNWSVYKLTS